MELSLENRAQWLKFWSECYGYPQPHLYDANIRIPLTADSIVELFTWKNGTPLSQKKAASVVANYVSAVNAIPMLASVEDGRKYIKNVSGGAIWRIFWLHCLNPDMFPIFDQHTYRAMHWIKNGQVQELPAYNPSKIQIYFDRYLPFWDEFEGVNERALDRALFAYGKSKKQKVSSSTPKVTALKSLAPSS